MAVLDANGCQAKKSLAGMKVLDTDGAPHVSDVFQQRRGIGDGPRTH